MRFGSRRARITHQNTHTQKTYTPRTHTHSEACADVRRVAALAREAASHAKIYKTAANGDGRRPFGEYVLRVLFVYTYIKLNVGLYASINNARWINIYIYTCIRCWENATGINSSRSQYNNTLCTWKSPHPGHPNACIVYCFGLVASTPRPAACDHIHHLANKSPIDWTVLFRVTFSGPLAAAAGVWNSIAHQPTTRTHTLHARTTHVSIMHLAH